MNTHCEKRCEYHFSKSICRTAFVTEESGNESKPNGRNLSKKKNTTSLCKGQKCENSVPDWPSVEKRT